MLDLGLQPAWAYCLLGAVAGAGCLLPAAELVLAGRTRNARSPRRWVAGWLAGPWLAILVAYATGLWGDYGSHIKRPLRSPELAAVLTGNVVDFVMPASDPNGTGADAVLLVLYTPDPGQKRVRLSDVPSGRHAWVHDEALADGAPGGELVGRVGAWSLLCVAPLDD